MAEEARALHKIFCLIFTLAFAVLVAACSSGGQALPGEIATSTTSTLATTTTSSLATSTTNAPTTTVAVDSGRVSGMFDVGGGIELYMECEGSGSPTIVYLHGSIDNAAFSAPASSAEVRKSLGGDYRFCSYNRRNVGLSDKVDGYFTGLTAVEDLHGLMATAGIDPPYVILGASFGGLIAHLYAATYPDDVVGIVSLDGLIPQDITLDPLLPEDMRYDPDEDRGTVERLSHYAALHEALDLTPPDVPFHYLLATPSDWPTLGVPAYDEVILDVVADYVASYPRGVIVEVASPHYMEPAVPDTIAVHLRQAIQEAGY